MGCKSLYQSYDTVQIMFDISATAIQYLYVAYAYAYSVYKILCESDTNCLEFWYKQAFSKNQTL